MVELIAQAVDVATEELVERGIDLTNRTLLYFGCATLVYLGLLFGGRALKRRLGLPLGWVYHLFCIGAGLFLPTLLPGIDPPGEREAGTFLILTGTFVTLAFIRHYLYDRFRTQQGSAQIPKFLSQFISIALLVTVFLFVLSGVYGLPIPGLLAGAGVAGIVLGLALQDTLGNIFSGFAIYFGGQFKVGDWLFVDDKHAQIVEINWRSTRLRTTDDVCLDIPNSNITKQTVINYSHPTPVHAVRFEIGLSYDAPPSLAKKVLVEAALDCPHVLRTPEPQAFLHEFADWSVTYQLRFWLDDHVHYNPSLSHIRTTLWYSLARHGIAIPYPIQHEMSLPQPPAPPDPTAAIRESLSKAIFAPCLSPAQLDQLASAARIVRFGAGESIIRQNAEAGPMYVLVSGRAEVWIETNGQRTAVATLEEDACIGETSVLTGENRSATVLALEDCTAVEVDKALLAPILGASPELLESLSDLLARRKLQNEGLVAGSASATSSGKGQAYRAGFLNKLKTFFDV